MRSLPLLLSHQIPKSGCMWKMEAYFQPSVIEWMSTFTRARFNFVNELFTIIFPSERLHSPCMATNIWKVFSRQTESKKAKEPNTSTCISHVITTLQIHRLDWEFGWSIFISNTQLLENKFTAASYLRISWKLQLSSCWRSWISYHQWTLRF
jgi:hypothetical protein